MNAAERLIVHLNARQFGGGGHKHAAGFSAAKIAHASPCRGER